MSKSQVSDDEWVSRNLHSAKYFLRPYLDEIGAYSVMTRKINGTVYTVYRSNHGLAHSFRQGFLARDIITLLSREYQRCCTTDLHPIQAWLKVCLDRDPKFSQKIGTLSSFQRSGRESEVSSKEDPELYAKYERSDCTNFIEAFSNRSNSLKEIEEMSRCLIWDTKHNDMTLEYVSRIIKAAHLLDLRRIPRFDQVRIMKETSDILMLKPTSHIMKELWKQSGVYLGVSGDRDMLKRKEWEDKFFLLQNKPKTLYFALRKEMIR